VRFAANVDPRDLERALEGADPKTTLFVVASKTFTTQETMSNAAAAKKWGGKVFLCRDLDVEAAKQFGANEILPMLGLGRRRFSVWSAVGFAAACAIGFDKFQEFLSGAHEIDATSRSAAREEHRSSHGVDRGVERQFPRRRGARGAALFERAAPAAAYLQQLEMESNGKRVDREGRVLNYATVPVVWGMEVA